MNISLRLAAATLLLFLPAMIIFSACDSSLSSPTDAENVGDSTTPAETTDRISRGQYLANIGSCGDCHSPKIFTGKGPVVDTTRLFAGHPEKTQLGDIDLKALQPGNWALMAPDATAFVGPWGVSFAANLTPDSATGIGAWSEEVFINTLRSGKHLGQPAGRPILPPMPWYFIGKMTDDDMKSLYLYFQSLPAVRNRVPEAIAPGDVGKLATKQSS